MLFRFVGEAAKRGRGVIVVSARMDELKRVSDRVCMLSDDAACPPGGA
jgi:ABC-type sugar transport system ATPase subunit